MPYAQTNIQLYNQLSAACWSDTDLRQVHAAYETAISLFGGLYRPNHKPFVAHLVGTASILAAEGALSTIVAAGMLHPVYSHGEFGDGSRGISEAKRSQVRRAVGAACEALIAQYAAYSWDLNDLETLCASAGRLAAVDQVAVLIKLADTLEDYCEGGMRYCPRKGPAAEHDLQAWRQGIVQLALALGRRSLAAELDRAMVDGDAALPRIPDFLRSERVSSFTIVPVSHRMRTSVRLGRVYRLLRDKLDRPGKDHSRRAA